MIQDLTRKTRRFWEQCSSRERLLTLGSVIVLGGMLLYSVVLAPVAEAFGRQSVELRQLSNAFSVAPDILGRYANLISRRNAIESIYQKADVKTNPLSHLERLLRETAQVAPGMYRVEGPREGTQLGGKFRHQIFDVTFPVTNLANLSAFLKELTTGPQPMLVSQIIIDKRMAQDNLEVKLVVSGFEAVGAQ